MSPGQVILSFLTYILAARLALAWRQRPFKTVAFALLNIVAVWVLLYPAQDFLSLHKIAIYGVYIGLAVFQYLILARFADAAGWRPWLAFFTPIAILVAIKYLPAFSPFWKLVHHEPFTLVGNQFIGISYLAFRASYLVLEIRNGEVNRPGLWEYLAFCFFMPTMSVGPINRYSTFQKGFTGADRTQLPLGRSLSRIVIGLVKYLFLAHPCYQLSYAGLLLDGHPHRFIELSIAAVFFYLYLYCNFSGFCDIAIGLAGLLGFPVEENFQEPFAARNLQEFWNRWHITLSRYMRDVVFTPSCKWMVSTLRIQPQTAVAAAIVIVYLLVGIWHGVGWNYFLFGVVNALGVVTVHYYAIALKKWLGRDGFKAYMANRWIRAIALATTFCYFASSLFFFANTMPQIQKILSVLK